MRRPTTTVRGLMLIVPLLLPAAAVADEGKPVAIRRWADGVASVETFWNLSVVVDRHARTVPGSSPRADLLLLPGGGATRDVPTLSLRDRLDHVLDRPPNAAKPAITRRARSVSPDAIGVRTVGRGDDGMLLIEADGVRVVHAGTIDGRAPAGLGAIDVLLIEIGDDPSDAIAFIRSTWPRIVVPLDLESRAQVDALRGRMPPGFGTMVVPGNTLAVRKLSPIEAQQPMLVWMEREPWVMPDDLAALFEAKEKACRAAQPVFAALSVKQMNHRPSNGTHTPRWNVEHMAGRELGFFSSIYSNVDPAVRVIDLNPKQMPPDYVARHPDWDGAEEARHMERVQAFTRRFSYLLADLPLDALPAGAPRFAGSLRGLFDIMERHYGEHTANVKVKFELPDWPDE